jgi:hypothetical protein
MKKGNYRVEINDKVYFVDKNEFLLAKTDPDSKLEITNAATI